MDFFEKLGFEFGFIYEQREQFFIKILGLADYHPFFEVTVVTDEVRFFAEGLFEEIVNSHCGLRVKRKSVERCRYSVSEALRSPHNKSKTTPTQTARALSFTFPVVFEISQVSDYRIIKLNAINQYVEVIIGLFR
ncbi:hypothetical protein [Runella sp.]|uniref:hypothetical protein n=1 Tax=Runella sp. TaxID=1960881 RepID=UPI00262AC6DE|nr:hypothetical protein [Runella sp.]